MSEVDELPIEHIITQMQKECIAGVLRIAEQEGLSPWTYEDYEAEIDREDSVTLQAISSETGELLGFIVMRLITIKDSDFPSNFNLLNIGVENSTKKRGVGSNLLIAALQRTSAHSPAEIWLEVRSGNLPAISFYRKHGFEQEGTRRNFYRHPDEDAIVMKLAV